MPVSLNCPVCHGDLPPFQFHNVEVNICPKGCGTWFDWDELEDIEQSDTPANIEKAFPGVYHPRAVKEAIEQDAPRNCPRHPAQRLTRYEWDLGSGIVFDKCSTCNGLWLDAGEIEAYTAVIHKFEEHPPKLTPELAAQLEVVRKKTAAEVDASLDKVPHLLPHLLWFDRPIRRLVGTMVNQASDRL